jgi:hypothetical protein
LNKDNLISFVEENKLSVVYSDGKWYCVRVHDDCFISVDECACIDGHIDWEPYGVADTMFEAIVNYIERAEEGHGM